MIKILISIVFISSISFASINDDIHIYKAMKFYKNSEYKEAYENFEKIENKTDQIVYNMANSLYKQKKYRQAIKLYQKIKNENLAHKKYHNIANSYIFLENYEKAIEYYNKALKYSNDERTKFNLAMSENIKQEIEIEKLKRDNITNKMCRTGNRVIWSDIVPEDVELKEDKKLSFLLRFDNISNLEFEDENKKGVYISEGKREDDNKTVLRSKEKLKIDHYQKQKWDRKIENSSINTLIIPMEKGVVNDSKKPW